MSLAFAVLAVPAFRRCLASVKMLAALAVTALVILPHMVWMLEVGLDLIGTAEMGDAILAKL